MTEKEILRILSVCKGAGVNFGDADEDVIIEIWKNCFKDFTYQEVSKALFKLINSKKGLFLNGLIAEIKEQIVSDNVDFLDFPTAWETIRNAMHRTHPDIPSETIKAFNSLPPILKHLVGSARHLEDMEYCLDRDDLETVEKSNMKKMYAELVIKSKEQMQLGNMPEWVEIDIKKLGKLEGSFKKLVEGSNFGG